MKITLLLALVALCAVPQSSGCYLDLWIFARSQPGERFYDVEHARGVFVALGERIDTNNISRSFVSQSTNGVDWISRDLPDGPEAFTKITYATDSWWLISSGGNVLSSTDLENWQTLRIPSYGIAGTLAVGGHVYSVNQEGTIFQTSNGLDWSSNSVTTNYTLGFGKAENSLFVLTENPRILDGFPGSVFKSSDGIAWAELPVSWKGRPHRIVSGAGVSLLTTHTAIGSVEFSNHEVFYRSENQKDWEEIVPGIFQPVHDLVFENGLFMIVASDNRVYRSTQAREWKSSFLTPYFDPRAASFGANRFVVVGRGGILVSPDVAVPCLHISTQEPKFSFELFGKADQPYTIEYSDDLKSWQSWTNIVLASGVTLFQHQPEIERRTLFFRAHLD